MDIQNVCIFQSFFSGTLHVAHFKQSKNLVQGERLQLDCEASGFPVPTVHWLKDGAPIDKSDSRVSFANFGNIDNATLSITDVDYDDASDYTCVASNSMTNSANSTVTVRVKGNL